MIATSFWEAYTEGRNAWSKGKLGWKIKIGKHITITAYHFWVFVIMFPALLALTFVNSGWNTRLLGALLSAYFSGLVLEDLFWYVVNPKVKFKELWSPFSNYYPWIKIQNRKIVPLGYVIGIIVAISSWYFLWK